MTFPFIAPYFPQIPGGNYRVTKIPIQQLGWRTAARMAGRRHHQTNLPTQSVKLLFVINQLFPVLFLQPIQKEFAAFWRFSLLHFLYFRPIHKQEKIQVSPLPPAGVSPFVVEEKNKSFRDSAEKFM